ncbi:MAG: cytidine deaminase [Ruminococcaceae bacterium]|nr:cytidine deaminase [Oscillospiraceae bacterium]
MRDLELMEAALRAREAAYAPYSRFRVGAALLSSDGTLYTGCNVENASYSLTNCAERVAFGKAVSEGMRSFSAIAIVGGCDDASDFSLCAPCGACRQVMAEFCNADFRILLGDPSHISVYTLAELLPFSFSLEKDQGGTSL